MRKFADWAFAYGLLAFIGGVFYREFTKFMAYEGVTTLSFVHVHYLALGVLFPLALLGIAHAYEDKLVFGKEITAYHAGLNLSVALLVVRGIVQVLGVDLSGAQDAALSGVAGLGHILLGVSLMFMIHRVRLAVR